MKKTVEYVVRTTENAITHEKQTVPVVVNRRDPVDLVDVIANCIDRNLILGAKPTAAQGIAEGIAEQLAVEFKKGNGVKFGKYFYGRLYLNGTTERHHEPERRPRREQRRERPPLQGRGLQARS